MKARNVRDQIVLATKFTTCFPDPTSKDVPRQKINYAGNSTKSLHVSLEASLKKLQTDYIDVLYLHWWDFTTGIPEVMQSLNHMVQRGKVLYLGVSDTPAWVVSKANQCKSSFTAMCKNKLTIARCPRPRPPYLQRLPRSMVRRPARL